MKLVWEKITDKKGHWLRAKRTAASRENGQLEIVVLREEDLIPVQEWSAQNNCGTRMSFDMWRFKNEKDMMAFMLRWC